MIKKIYNISGFDCANCAKKTECYLSKREEIEDIVLDFAGDKLFVTYKDKELSIKELKKIIKEVESDEIEITEVSHEKKKVVIFDKHFFFVLARLLFCVIVLVLSHTVLDHPEYFWVNFGLYLVAILVITYDVFYKVFLHIRHLQNPIDEYLLISLASVGAFTLASLEHNAHEFMESIMVTMLWQVGKIIEGYATNKSKAAISNTASIRSETAKKLLDNGEVEEVSPELLNVGDLVMVTSGDLIPIDGVVNKGESYLDVSSLTGEFVPIYIKENEEVFSGCLVKEGTLVIKATKRYKDSTVSKILNLISSSGQKKSKADEFVTKFARWYTPIVFIVSLLTAIIGGAISTNWYSWIILGLKMMVVACPCAIVISVPLAYFSSLGLASKNGIIIKGTNYLDEIYNLKKVITDKTGTLTKGVFKITEVHPNNIKEDELLNYLVTIEKASNHPIGKAISNTHLDIDLGYIATDFEEFAGMGVYAKVNGETILAGNASLLELNEIAFNEASSKGTVIYCSKGSEYLGYVVVSDEIKDDSVSFVKLLSKEKIELILLTGDKEENAKEFASKLGITSYHSELLPDQKVSLLEKELNKKYKVAYIGDGINDAASIRLADIGVAMGAIGSDVAVDNADVIIMNDKPSRLVDAYKISKIARHTAIFNIVFALVVKFSIEALAFIFNLLGKPEAIPMWLAVLADTGLTVLLVINSLLILYRKISHKGI